MMIGIGIQRYGSLRVEPGPFQTCAEMHDPKNRVVIMARRKARWSSGVIAKSGPMDDLSGGITWEVVNLSCEVGGTDEVQSMAASSWTTPSDRVW